MANMKFWVAAALTVSVLSGCGGNDTLQQNAGDAAAVTEGLDVGAAKELAMGSAGAASSDTNSSTLPTDGEIIGSDDGDTSTDDGDTSTDDGEDSLSGIPNPAASTAIGFGRSVTGAGTGSDVEKVRVTSTDELARALCSTEQGGGCTDTTPRIIEVASTIDFTHSQGQGSAHGCVYSACKNGSKPERLVMLDQKDAAHCYGKQSTNILYDKAGTESLLVGSNKTLIGVGASGAIKGKGLILRNNVSNIIIRNLTFSDINTGIIFAGDAIRLGNTDRVWIDHNRFVRIGRQMIVSGWQGGAASNVTISWNDFDGTSQFPLQCNGKHYWNLLLTGKNDTITFASNWMRNFSGRSPAVHGTDSFVHLFNNYFDEGSGTALDVTKSNRVLVEGNYFKNVRSPITRQKSDHGDVFGIHAKTSAVVTKFCKSRLKRNCVPNATPGSGVDNFTWDIAVLKGDVLKELTLSPYGTKNVPLLVPKQAGPGHLGRR